MGRSRIVFAVLLVLVANGAMAGVIPRPAATGASGRTQVYLLGSQGGQQRTQLTGAGIRSGPSALIVVDGHGSLPSVGYRFETPDLKIVFSGDRGDRGDELARFATGADVLFHEISDLELVKAALEGQGAPPKYVDHQLHDHSGGELVGRTATDAGVPKLVLYHLVPGTPAISDERWRSLVSPFFAGEIVVGKDLLEL